MDSRKLRYSPLSDAGQMTGSTVVYREIEGQPEYVVDAPGNWKTTHVGKRAERSVVKIARVPAFTGGTRRHVDIAFHFPDAAPLTDGSLSACMSRTQAHVLARRILEAAK